MLIPDKKLKLHSSDIKDMFITNDIFITCSRDNKITISTKDTYKQRIFNYGYLNTLDYSNDIIYIGTQSGFIILYNILNDKEYSYKVHNDNISVLKVNSDTVITGSWDNSLKVFNINNLNESIFEGNVKGSVLSISLYKTGFIVGLETGAINFYKRENNKYFYSHSLLIHNHPIRDLFTNESGIHSIAHSLIKSNDKCIIEYTDYDSFLFSICDKMIVGDNGFIVYLNNIYQLNVGCIWKVIRVNNNYFLGCSDGCVYVFKEEGESIYFKNDDLQVKDEFNLTSFVKESNISDKLSDDYKIEKGIIYQRINDEYISLGRIKYDSSFSIEIENRIINVHFNKNESPNDVASRVIKEERIDSSYKEEIAEFIAKNFQEKGKYKYFTTLPIDKVINLLKEYNCESIINLLRENSFNDKINNEFNYNSVENELSVLRNECKFLCLDLIRYFYSKNIKSNINFLFKFKPENKKESIAYVRLITNLFGKVNFNLNVFREEIKRIEDNRIIDKSILDDYEYNRISSLK